MAGAIRATSEARGTGRIIVASFTKTAATEIAGRGIPLPRNHVGTLHALAYQAIGRPEVTGPEQIADWNTAYPHLLLSGAPVDLDVDQVEARGATDADKLMAEVDIYRSRMVDPALWRPSAQRFHQQWTDWKSKNDLIDFTDMISLALETTEHGPDNPVVGFYDEVQDFSALDLALVRRWGESMERIVLSGDDDQAIFGFRGASHNAFLDPPVPEDQKRILDQSFRVPRAVHQVAQAWVEQLTRREPKDYKPRDADGVARVADFYMERPQPLVEEIQRMSAEQVRDTDTGMMRPRTVMVLATCSYMLDSVKHELREQGVPFHNVWRRRRGDWNPMGTSRGTSSAAKLLCYLVADERIFGDDARFWSGDDIKKWTSVIRKKGVFRRGMANAVAGLPDRELNYEEVANLFSDEVDLNAALEPSLDWFKANLVPGSVKPMEYPIRVAQRDPRLLAEKPLVTLGTIHSVKGAEADVTVLAPDLSMAGMREWMAGGGPRDGVIRQMYVGMTRAREELVIIQPSGRSAVDPAQLLRGQR